MATDYLEAGESVRTAVGPLAVAENRGLARIHEVFNLEVESEHAYLTSELGVPSHNTDGGKKSGGWPAKLAVAKGGDQLAKLRD